FKLQNFDEHVAQGRAKLDRELHRAGAVAVNQEKVAQKLHFQKLEDCLAAIGRGDVSEHQLTLAIQEFVSPKADELVIKTPVKRHTATQADNGIVIEGVGNLHTTFAKCCKPMPPDGIVAYLTRGSGVTIHRAACSFISRLPEGRRNRVLNAQWGAHQHFSTNIDIEIEAEDRQGLLRDISDLFAREKINATRANTVSRNHMALMQFSIEIPNAQQLNRLLGLLQQVPSVVAVRRRD
ncbi:MAG: ACT domain-containing protein, partial [Methylotenera sp.]